MEVFILFDNKKHSHQMRLRKVFAICSKMELKSELGLFPRFHTTTTCNLPGNTKISADVV